MRPARLRRATIALAAAYALALQALLSAFAPAAAVAADGALAVLCSGAAVLSDDAPSTPAEPPHDCAACVMPGCGAAPLPDGASAILRQALSAAAASPERADREARPAIRTPQVPRAPPAA